MKKQKKIPGAIVKISIDGRYHTYARICAFGDLAFYDCRTDKNIENLKEIVSKPILFRTNVNDRGVKDGVYPIIGELPLEEDLKVSKYYLADAVQPDYFRIYENGQFRDAIKEECLGLEPLATWDPIHIKQRLKDYYEGKKNKNLEMLDVLKYGKTK